MHKSVDGSGLDLNRYVGLRLRLCRKTQLVSLEDLAEAIGVSRQQLQKYETGINRISAVTLFRLSQHLAVPLSYFFEGLPESEAPCAPQAVRVRARV